ncbi:hypothetical protein MRBLMR1_002454 [Neorhizobium sp. LMR1-1-1.1]
MLTINISSLERDQDSPNQESLSAAPLLKGWAVADEGPWMHCWFYGHPEIQDGTHGHTLNILEIDAAVPPRWAKTEDRLYRLGIFYPPAEREIRYWVYKQSGLSPVMPDGSDDIEAMVSFLRSSGRIRRSTIDRLERAYLEEQDSPRTGA